MEIEKYFQRVVFNYLFSNGDAHLKNFSLSQTPSGDFVLSPAYDMIDTRIHIPSDSFFALSDGLFSGNYVTDSFKLLGFYEYDDFYEFGIKIGMMQRRVGKILDKYRTASRDVNDLIQRSFLSINVKELFQSHYVERMKMLNNSFSRVMRNLKMSFPWTTVSFALEESSSKEILFGGFPEASPAGISNRIESLSSILITI